MNKDQLAVREYFERSKRPVDSLVSEDSSDASAFHVGLWFQSAVSGAWYLSRTAAGEVSAVKIDGKVYLPIE